MGTFKQVRFTNNFDFLRIVGIVGVIYLHSYHLLNKGEEEWLHKWLPAINWPFIFLAIFFALSGYLITGSVLHSSSLYNYFWKRLLRVQPLLTLVCLLSVFVVGALYTSSTPAQYFTDINTWTYFRNIVPALGVQFHLPKVFENNIGESGVNGSLWTLVVEERLYMLVAVLYFIKRSLRKYLYAIVLLNIVFLLANTFLKHVPVFGYFQSWHMLFVVIFFNASFFYICKIPFSSFTSVWYILGAFTVSVITLMVPQLFFFSVITVPFFIILIGHVKGITNKTAKWGDFSYGMYVLSFPVQQMLIQSYRNDIGPLYLFGLSMAIVLPLSVLSWHFLEAKFLLKKDRVK